MDDTIITIYCLCDDFLKAMSHRRDDPHTRLSTAEVMTIPLVASTFFGGNIDKTRRFLHEYGYMPKMTSKGRFNHRMHAIDPALWQGLFSLLAEFFKRNNSCNRILDLVIFELIPGFSSIIHFIFFWFTNLIRSFL